MKLKSNWNGAHFAIDFFLASYLFEPHDWKHKVSKVRHGGHSRCTFDFQVQLNTNFTFDGNAKCLYGSDEIGVMSLKVKTSYTSYIAISQFSSPVEFSKTSRALLCLAWGLQLHSRTSDSTRRNVDWKCTLEHLHKWSKVKTWSKESRSG